ncbi:MCP four helix bundle domain-containing protein [Paraburkholderia phenoliruptrix]|uniref:MCP four helix bundle domain-containing protein n=1 Tax=Paraburkholderia phenoliruptrix TaxID=252970 RepID=A0ABV3WLN7_9BURK
MRFHTGCDGVRRRRDSLLLLSRVERFSLLALAGYWRAIPGVFFCEFRGSSSRFYRTQYDTLACKYQNRCPSRRGFRYCLAVALPCRCYSGVSGVSHLRGDDGDSRRLAAAGASTRDVRTWANNVRKASLRSLLETDAKQKATQRALCNEAMKMLDGKLQAYQQLAMTAEDEQLSREIRKTWSNYLMLDDKLLTLSEGGEASFAAARTLATGESADAFTAVARLIEQAVQSSTTVLAIQH